ncbi:TRAG family protein [Solidesulfovibrio carbinoliphilus subsp. oakridgensis]|uniref:TRAG family protein n=1 Tax=Solidesulfovibrio carbinoliphilus subsp. oakridgensis TaxID=694327 RepID=G7QB79_9BACT|nr:type IV secretory system conjugative DNA transfer family protein [Solidesulfovibrio carbinoliphilus]EHJ48821.1 TRAG family protein [Solidesulfovibrio carbinoliphilus subsp. oakridgensis]
MNHDVVQYGLGGSKIRRRTLRWGYLFFMVVLALASMSRATQLVASHFGPQAALGQPWGQALGITWYAPWKILSWHSWGVEHEAVKQAESQAQMLFLVPQFVVLGFALLGMRKPKAGRDIHGSAHWATEQEIQEMGLLDGRGVYLGGWVKRFEGISALYRRLCGYASETQRYLRHNGPEHVLLYAPTRSGKGVGVILPTLLSFPDSVVVLDIKGENWALTSGWRQSQGQKVLQFDPSDAGGGSVSFNPLDEVRLDTLLAIPDVQNIATMVVDPEGKGLQDHWSKAGFAFIAGALLHCLVMVRHREKRTATLHDLGTMLADESRSIDDLFEEMLKTDHAAKVKECFPKDPTGGDEIHTFIASSAREMLNKAPNEASGVVSTALVNLALYRDPVVALNTSRSDFRVQDLMNHETPVSLYLVMSPADVNRLRPLIRLILNLIISRICEKMEFIEGVQVKPKRRLLLLLDEFTSIGKMEIVNKSIAYTAGYGINYLIVIQNIEQLNDTYGKENGIKGNCHVRVAYAPNTLETARELSEMTGKTTVVSEKTSLSGSRSGHLKNASVSLSETARPLLTSDECLRLPGLQKKGDRVVKAGDVLIFVAGRSAIYGRQILYFLDPVFSKRVKVPAPAKSDSLCPAVAGQEAKPAMQTEQPEAESGYAAYLKKQDKQVESA